MYYNRTLDDSFSKLFEPQGELRWLIEFVKSRDDLDILIGRNDKSQFLSVYRGLTRIISICPTKKPKQIKLYACDRYKNIIPLLFGIKDLSYNFQKELELLLVKINNDKGLERYYNNKKEGYYQNILSRKYGIDYTEEDDFIIVDKESVIGYSDTPEKERLFKPLQNQYKNIQAKISKIDPIRYGKDLSKKHIGNELDFLAVDNNGNILLIELKDGSNTSGIYLCPLQIGLYTELFENLDKNKFHEDLNSMIQQKKKIGLINPNFEIPKPFNEIVPVLIISNYNPKSVGKDNLEAILKIIRTEKGADFLKMLRIYNYTDNNGLQRL